MKLIIPNNLFSVLFASILPEDVKKKIEFRPASTISKQIEEDDNSIGLIPSIDMLGHNELFLSKKFALAFDGNLAVTNIYFKEGEQTFEEFNLRGDITTNEIILSKIIFSEKYNTEVDTKLDSQPFELNKKNYIVTGNENLNPELIKNGISFADEIADMIDFPYVNFLFAAKDQKIIEDFNSLFDEVDKKIEDSFENFLKGLNFTAEVNDFIRENINSVYFDLTDNEIAGATELLRLPYYQGIIDEMHELKFV